MRRAIVVLALLIAASASAEDRLRVTAAKATLFSRPAADSFALLSLEKGAELVVLDRAGDWYSARVVASTVKGAVGVKGYVARADVEPFTAREEAAPPPAPPAASAPAPRPTPKATPAPTEPTPVERAPVEPEPARPVAPTPTPRPAPPRQEPVPAAKVVPSSPPPTRVAIFLNGAFAPSSLNIDQTLSFTEFAETGSVDVKYAYAHGWGGELGLRYFFLRELGVEVGGSFLKRSGSADYSGKFPHPLYLNRPRTAAGTQDSLSYQETAGYFNLVYGGATGKLGYAIFGGVAYFFKIEPDLLGVPVYTQTYPYDTITVTSVPTTRPSEKKVGFDVGGELEYRFTENAGAAVGVRYSKATADFALPDANTLSIDAGGLYVTVGLRFRF